MSNLNARDNRTSERVHDQTCRFCNSSNLERVYGPHPGGHYARINCLNCNRLVKWEGKPKALKAVDPRGEVSKKLVAQYSRGFCEICLRNKSELPAPQTLEGHHIIQVCDGGTDEQDNIMIVCTPCHKLIHHLRTYLGHYHQGDEQGRVAS